MRGGGVTLTVDAARRTMFEALRPMLTKLDLLGGRWYQSANDGFDGNNSATEAM